MTVHLHAGFKVYTCSSCAILINIQTTSWATSAGHAHHTLAQWPATQVNSAWPSLRG